MFGKALNTHLEFEVTASKFERLNLLVQVNLCTVVITKTELDHNISRVQLVINGFK